jgi:glucosamine--fructose-6-phosphate aminotransferase (isomerizing)
VILAGSQGEWQATEVRKVANGANVVAGVATSAAVNAEAGGYSAGRPVRLESIAAHPAIEPMLFVQSFYRVANALSIARGRDPDSPPHLSKVTETL